MALVELEEIQKANQRFVKSAMKLPLLALEDEQELARRWVEERDEKALHTLTSAHMRLVVSMASKFKNYGLAMSDLIQEGNIGLMRAAERFDCAREVRFSTYAGWWIRAAIQDFVLRNWSIVRTGTTASQKSLFFNLRRLRAKINDNGTYMSDTTRDYIGHTLGVKKEDIQMMEGRLSGQDRSLNAPMSDDSDSGQMEWQDTLQCQRPIPEAEVANRLDTEKCKTVLMNALQTLSSRELTIIKARRINDDSRTLDDLGRELGVSKERVRQIEHEALVKLKSVIMSQDDGRAIQQLF